MEGRIVSYRRGKHTEYANQYIITMEGANSKEDAVKYVGRKVVWKTTSGKEMVGKITNTHGNGGALLARFEKGLPGQVLGSTVNVE